MTPNKFNAALLALGFATEHPVTGTLSLGQSEFADLINVNSRTVRRWASGEAEVPTAVVLLINLMLSTKATIEDLKP